MTGDLWRVRTLPDGLDLELHAGSIPALVLVQGDNTIRIELTRVKALVAALTDAPAGLTAPLRVRRFLHTPKDGQ